ncbi:ATP-dependent RNA helicase HrpA [Thiothrix eikelboomii]|uniref:ATP-dependent RNA helicase HrpA n=1 Tax=Thiothrix eikelboomii TaxID=92487 RepID=UPI003BB0F742
MTVDTPTPLNHSQLRKQLNTVMGSDRFRLRRELQQLERKPDEARAQRLLEKIEASHQRRSLRMQNKPQPDYPDDLPVAQRREEIIKAIQEHQVVVICGETGSGKTTQLPKMCLDAGRGIDGLIGHTQPRRIAARSVADRIAEELKTQLGQQVGYKVRFTDRTHQDSYIKLMTDGILLAEIQQDRYLNDYDTLIIDEAHERSLNIDFLLGYLKWLLPKRRDLKIIITSATIDPQRFAEHFNGAPIIEVSGRTYPVELRYRPLVDLEGEDERDLTEAILDAVDELGAIGSGDILVFLPGEREIRETAEALRKHHPPSTEILPLYARLSAEEQHRVFEAHGRRRVVLATNVAETSLTVPGIRYVVDAGLARMSRYSWRAGVQRLPIEKVSQASANQRSGRCGRVAAGVAIRLYSEDDYNSRPLFTEPEILRTNLASVILQMETMQLGEIEKFPFVEAPDLRLIRDGYKLLFEIGAVDADFNLTQSGHTLAKLPVDPRLGKMLLTAEKEGALKEVLVIAAALAIQDPRERPMDKQQAADEKHARFKAENSDFLSLLALWDYFHQQRKALSKSQFRKLCLKEFLSWTRLQEWHDIHQQIRSTLLEVGIKENEKPAEYSGIHRSLLSGLLGNIGLKDEDLEYQGANGRKFFIFPGSNLRKKAPQWIMASELVETSKLYARTVAKIESEWIEEFGAHLLKRHYTEPHWEQNSANVAAFERTSLYGITVTPKRRVSYGRIDPVMSREIFIRHALVYGEYKTQAAFFRHNGELIAQIEELEAKGRRRDILADEKLLYDFFDPLIPANIVNGASFEKWRKQAESKNPKLLYLTRDYSMQRDAGHERSGQFPDSMAVQSMILPLRYHFEPNAEDDGVTVRLPLLALNQLSPIRFDYLVPGMLEEKLTAMIRALPKQIRKQFVPAPDYARACLEAIEPSETLALKEALGQQLLRMSGSRIETEAWEQIELPEHLLMRFEVVDDSGVVVNAGRDLSALRNKVGQQAKAELIRQPTQHIERQGLTEWSFGDLPTTHLLEMGGMKLHTWPALYLASPQASTVDIKLFDNEAEAQRQHRLAVLRLFMLALPAEARDLPRQVPQMQQLCLHYAASGKCDELKDSMTRYAFRQAFVEFLDTRQQASFSAAVQVGRKHIFVQAQALARMLAPALTAYHEIRKLLKGKLNPAWLETLNDVNDQLAHLIYPNFLDEIQPDELRHLPRYLKGIQRRLEKMLDAPTKDRALRVQVQPHWERYKQRLNKDRSQMDAKQTAALHEYRWMVEEFRISLFAQELGTAKPVSAKRLDKVWEEV